MNKTNYATFLILSFFLIVQACHRDSTELLPEGSDEKYMISFELKKELNADFISGTIQGEIEDSIITLTVDDTTNLTQLIPSFDFEGANVFIGNELQTSGENVVDFSKKVLYSVLAEDGTRVQYRIQINLNPTETADQNVLPVLHLDLEDPDATYTLDPGNKKTKFTATLKIDGKGIYENYEGEIKIRGRGNSSWGMPKKPYRMDFPEETSLFGLAAARKWVLLNNYLDGTLLGDALPFKMGHLLEMPFTPHILPVEVVFNGDKIGVYSLTENKDVAPGRIDLKSDGLLLELDSYYDEEFKFRSAHYNLPVMVQYPEDENIDLTKLSDIRETFNAFEGLVHAPDFPDNEYLEYWDDTAFVNYLLVYQLMDNEEINHPKSTYLHKVNGSDKYHMGIIWDFDWGYGYERTGKHYERNTASNVLFWGTDYGNAEEGTVFFSRLMEDPHMQTLFRERWEWFKQKKYEELKAYLKEYSEKISYGLAADHQKWGNRGSTGNPEMDLQKVLDWLDARADYLDAYSSGW